MEEKRGQSVQGRREGEKTKSLFRVLEGDGQDGGGGVRWRGWGGGILRGTLPSFR